MLLIGSMALKTQGYDKTPRDLDVVCSYSEYEAWVNNNRSRLSAIYPTDNGKKMIAVHDGTPIEFEIGWEGTSAAELLNLTKDAQRTTIDILGEVQVADLDTLYALKMSHRYLRNSPAFLKTMRDIKSLRESGATIPNHLADWYLRRKAETYNYRHPSLMRNKQDFFSGDGITYVYDHDSIHVAMAHLERPAYTYFKRDDHEVAVDREKWEALPEQTKLYSVVEESYVLALERSQIPFRGKVDPHDSFLTALEKVCTSITSGWWREYAWENYEEALALYDETYVTRFWAAVEAGTVIPHKAA